MTCKTRYITDKELKKYKKVGFTGWYSMRYLTLVREIDNGAYISDDEGFYFVSRDENGVLYNDSDASILKDVEYEQALDKMNSFPDNPTDEELQKLGFYFPGLDNSN